MNVFLALGRFDTAGGSEEPLTVLAVQLKRLGHGVTVFCRQPAPPGNQYVRRLRAAGVGIVSPPGWLADLAGDWPAQDRLVARVMGVAGPWVAPAGLAASRPGGRGYRAGRRSVRGHLQARLSRAVHHDRSNRLLVALLEARALAHPPDIVHVFRGELAPALAWPAGRGCPSVYSELSVPGGMADALLWRERSADLNRATVVTALSRATADGLRQVAGVSRPILLAGPVVAQAPATVAVSGRADGRLGITCIARLSPEKGLDVLLQAARPVLAERADAELLIAGDGPLRAALARQAGALGLGDRVRFGGAFDHARLAEIMDLTDILVLPSLSEGLGYVILEAMAYGKPVVATDVGGVPELVAHGRTGLLVPPRDATGLAEALLALAGNAPRRREMGLAGREAFLEGGYGIEAFTETYLEVYRQAQALHRASRRGAARPGPARGRRRALGWRR